MHVPQRCGAVCDEMGRESVWWQIQVNGTEKRCKEGSLQEVCMVRGKSQEEHKSWRDVR